VNVSIVSPSPKAFELGSMTAVIDNIARAAVKTKYEPSRLPART